MSDHNFWVVVVLVVKLQKVSTERARHYRPAFPTAGTTISRMLTEWEWSKGFSATAFQKFAAAIDLGVVVTVIAVIAIVPIAQVGPLFEVQDPNIVRFWL